MKYIKIKNKGLLDIRLIALMGGTTKSDSTNKIGQFGTGLKYAISYFLRNDIPLKLFIDNNEVVFEKRKTSISDKEFDEIFMNGESMNITTRYGYQWTAWEAIREIWCNAIDESNSSKKIVSKCTKESGNTIFYIGITEETKKVLDNWDIYFNNDDFLFDDENYSIFLNKGDYLKLYKNGVLIHEDKYYKSLFNYDIKNSELNELRQYRGYAQWDIQRAIINSNKQVVRKLIESIKSKTKEDVIEKTMTWDLSTYDKTRLKFNFQGFLFLHPNSDKESSSSSVIVPESLFNLLSSNGMPCERINKISGGYYGGSGIGYSDKKDIDYKHVVNDNLKSLIFKILKKYNYEHISYTIASPIKSDFEILISNNQVVFNSSLENLQPIDLESIVMIAILHNSNGNIYKVLKRMIKFSIKNKNFKNLFFGNNIVNF